MFLEHLTTLKSNSDILINDKCQKNRNKSWSFKLSSRFWKDINQLLHRRRVLWIAIGHLPIAVKVICLKALAAFAAWGRRWSLVCCYSANKEGRCHINHTWGLARTRTLHPESTRLHLSVTSASGGRATSEGGPPSEEWDAWLAGGRAVKRFWVLGELR